MDIGMFIQSILLACQSYELATCPQAALAEYPDIVRKTLNIDSNFSIVCGIAMGYPDFSQKVNQYRTSRIEVDDFTTWHN